MQYIVKVGDMYVENAAMSPDWNKDSILKNIILSNDKIMNMSFEEKNILMEKLLLCNIKATVIESDNTFNLKQELIFLRKRENKLQRIEQLFKSEVVDLEYLTKLVKEDLRRLENDAKEHIKTRNK